MTHAEWCCILFAICASPLAVWAVWGAVTEIRKSRGD